MWGKWGKKNEESSTVLASSRKACWAARDQYFACLDNASVKTTGSSECKYVEMFELEESRTL